MARMRWLASRARAASLASRARSASLASQARSASLVATAAFRLLRERRAGLAIIFALSVIPVVGFVGLSADFAFCNQSKAQLDLAADSASMQATTTASAAFVASNPNYIALGQAAGTQWFTTQVGLLKSFVPTTVTPTVTISRNGGVFTSTVRYNASVTSSFGRLFGVSGYGIGGTSVTTVTTSPYIDITFLLDNSSSMEIAATSAGISQLEALTAPGATPLNAQSAVPGYKCAFACHWSATNNDYFGIARANNIQLRFDVLQSAVATSIQTMENLDVTEDQPGIPDQFGASIYTFNSGLSQVYPASGAPTRGTDLAAALTAAQNIQTPVSNDTANTDFPTIMAQLAASAPAAGDGSSATSPKKALILVTDGIADYGSRSIPSSEGPINPANCAAMKALGYNVYVLYTTYPDDPNILLFGNAALAPYLSGTNPTIVQNLTACASAASNFQQASDGPSIQAAMQTLVMSALSAGARVSQ